MDRQEIISFTVEELKSGKGLQQVCREQGFIYANVYAWLRRAGYGELVKASKGNNDRYKTFKPDILSADQVPVIKKMYEEQIMTLAEIAKVFNVNKVTIFNFCKKHGIQTRTKGEGTRLYQNRPDVKTATKVRMKRLALLGIVGVLKGRKYFNTGPELHFLNWCIENEYDVIQQFRVEPGGHPYDFYVIGTNLLVEIDGHYWHQRPEQVIKDNTHNVTAANMGFKVIRVVDLEQKHVDCYVKLKEEIDEQLRINDDR